jgi:hypothetical protein
MEFSLNPSQNHCACRYSVKMISSSGAIKPGPGPRAKHFATGCADIPASAVIACRTARLEPLPQRAM